jgi:hypothetical protein
VAGDELRGIVARNWPHLLAPAGKRLTCRASLLRPASTPRPNQPGAKGDDASLISACVRGGDICFNHLAAFLGWTAPPAIRTCEQGVERWTPLLR